MHRRGTVITMALAIGALGAAAFAGPEWVEEDNFGGQGQDAGSTPDGAMPTQGTGPLLRIRGTLTGAFSSVEGALDLEDVYVICIEDPDAFFASTVSAGGFAEFDSRLFLFELGGRGILGNHDPGSAGGTGFIGAELGNMATDSTGAAVVTSGLYLLAICTAPRTAISDGGLMYSFDVPGEVSGPDGPGFDGPLTAWSPDAVGACCIDGSCFDGFTAAGCASADGLYLGGATTCDEFSCTFAGAPIGRAGARGADPTQLTPPDGDAERGPSGQSAEYVIALAGTCFATAVPVGACEKPDGTCMDTTEFECVLGLGGTWLGPGTFCAEDEPGWNWVDNRITLTPNEPTYWAASTGLPKGLSPFTVLDPGDPPGRPVGDGSGDRVLRGTVYGWAVDAEGREIEWNHLAGAATVVDYRDGAAWQTRAWAVQAVDPNVVHGGLLPTPGELHLDGAEYAPVYDLLLLDFYAAGSSAFTGGAPVLPLTVDTELALHPVDLDVRQETDGPVTTKASFVVWNEDETQLTGMHRCITCWDQTLLSAYAPALNHFLLANLQTDKGKARIDGVASQNCDVDFDPGDQLPLGADPRDVVSADAALLGIARKRLDGPAATVAAGALNLVGLGTQSAVVRYDVVEGTPPTATAPGRAAAAGPGALGGADATAGSRGAAPQPGLAPGVDRVSGTEKGSLLIWSSVELRWNAAGDLVRDTFLEISNDWNGAVDVQLYLLNGDPPVDVP